MTFYRLFISLYTDYVQSFYSLCDRHNVITGNLPDNHISYIELSTIVDTLENKIRKLVKQPIEQSKFTRQQYRIEKYKKALIRQNSKLDNTKHNKSKYNRSKYKPTNGKCLFGHYRKNNNNRGFMPELDHRDLITVDLAEKIFDYSTILGTKKHVSYLLTKKISDTQYQLTYKDRHNKLFIVGYINLVDTHKLVSNKVYSDRYDGKMYTLKLNRDNIILLNWNMEQNKLARLKLLASKIFDSINLNHQLYTDDTHISPTRTKVKSQVVIDQGKKLITT